MYINFIAALRLYFLVPYTFVCIVFHVFFCHILCCADEPYK